MITIFKNLNENFDAYEQNIESEQILVYLSFVHIY